MTKKILFAKTKSSEKGFALLVALISILMVCVVIAVGLSFLVYNSIAVTNNKVNSIQSYYTAESGVEDSLLRLKNNMQITSPNTLAVGGTLASLTISDVIGGSRTIISEGNNQNKIRKVSVTYSITSDDVNFFYGIQAGDLGLTMNSNSIVYGNIYSNGNIIGAANAKIYGDTVVASTGNRIERISIKDDRGGGSAWADRLQNCSIDGDAHYNTISGTSVGGSHFTPEAPADPEQMPIDEAKINEWKSQAEAGGTRGDYFLGGNSRSTLGPIKVNGNFTIDSNAILTVTGTIWVTGNLNLNSNGIVYLDAGYGNQSGVIIVDGKITIDSNITICGSEGYRRLGECNPTLGSYLMLLSTNNSADPNSPAIGAQSNTKSAILYASNGLIKLTSNAKLREATGYGIYMSSNAEVTYETGLANARFSAGPGGSWQVTNWQEIE